MRIAWLLAISMTTMAGNAFQPNEDQPTRFMERARRDLTSVRDCTCLETIQRSRKRPPLNDFRPVDIIRLEVSTIAGKEMFASPGHRFEDRGVESVVSSGTVGSGMFSTFVRNLFVKRQGTVRYVREENIAGRRLARYDFRATRQDSGFRLQVFSISEMVAAKGSFWFDPASLDLVRLEIHGEDITYDLHLDDAVVRVDYARTHIGDSDALLPSRSELTITYISGDADRNTINFSQCRAYRRDSTVDFGKASNVPAPAVEPLPANPEPVPVETGTRSAAPAADGSVIHLASAGVGLTF